MLKRAARMRAVRMGGIAAAVTVAALAGFAGCIAPPVADPPDQVTDEQTWTFDESTEDWTAREATLTASNGDLVITSDEPKVTPHALSPAGPAAHAGQWKTGTASLVGRNAVANIRLIWIAADGSTIATSPFQSLYVTLDGQPRQVTVAARAPAGTARVGIDVLINPVAGQAGVYRCAEASIS